MMMWNVQLLQNIDQEIVTSVMINPEFHNEE